MSDIVRKGLALLVEKAPDVMRLRWHDSHFITM